MTSQRHRAFGRLPLMVGTTGAFLLLAGCATNSEEVQITPGLKAFTGARIIDGTGQVPIEAGVVLVRDGEIEMIGATDAIAVPADAERIDVTGKTIIPGLINTHGHVTPSSYTEGGRARSAWVVRTLWSDHRGQPRCDQEVGIQLRDRQEMSELNRARLYVAGPVVTAQAPEDARTRVNEVVDMNVDIVKIRVDDNLGARQQDVRSGVRRRHRSSARARPARGRARVLPGGCQVAPPRRRRLRGP